MNTANGNRRLAAIMFSDIVGYTSIMGENEDLAFSLLDKNRSLQIPLIKKHSGRFMKEIGDAILAVFPTDTDAVLCAKEILEASKEIADLSLRIGIHEGEITITDGDAFGDGVNIASRLQNLAPSDTIYLSENVSRNIQNKGIKAEFIGEENLKNVKLPIRVYSIARHGEQSRRQFRWRFSKRNMYFLVIVLAALAIYLITEKSTKRDDILIERSIAVLPFDNESDDAQNAYFVNGMTEDIRNNLSKISELRVISKTSTEKYRNTEMQIGEIGNELGVNYLLEGTVQKLDEEVKIHVQLVEANTDSHLWSETYIRELNKVFELQSQIANAISRELQAVITPEEQNIIDAVPTQSTEAYELYLRGKEYFYKGGESNLNVAVYFFQKSIEQDPDFALSYAWLGATYFMKNYQQNYYSESFGDSLKYYAEKSISINPNVADSHWLLANYYWQTSDTVNSTSESLKAIKIDPNHGAAYARLGMNYYAMRDYKKAERNLHKAKGLLIGDINQYPPVLDNLATMYMSLCDFDNSKSNLEEMAEYNPLYGNFGLSFLNIAIGDWERARYYRDLLCTIDDVGQCTIIKNYYYIFSDSLSALTLDPADSTKVPLVDENWKGYLLYKQNEKEEAKPYINQWSERWQKEIELKRASGTGGQAYYELAGYHAFMGEKDKAYEILHLMDDYKFDGAFVWIMQVDPRFKDMREEDEFQKIVANQERKLKAIRETLQKG